jgi:drug efflux transport system ATP-binding protein
MGADAAAIAARGLVKRFGRHEALRGIDLEVPSGALWGVVGADGAGKTTLLRCIAGLYLPDQGEVEPGERGQLRIGFAPQGFHLYRDLTVDENLLFFGGLYGIAADTLHQRIDELLGFAGLVEHRGRMAGTLSGGMQQKLVLACALVHRPPILLLDEPTTGVDPVSRREFWRLVEQLHSAGATILLASAYLDEIERCEHVVFLHDGGVIASGEPDQLRGAHASLEDAFLEAM